MLKRNRIANLIFETGIFLLLVVFFMALFLLVTPYIHETGHVIFGFLDGLPRGTINQFTISVWKPYPFLEFIKTPQQTKITSGQSSFNFALGGPIFSILVFFGLSLFGYLRSKDKKWFFLFFSVFVFEISGNIICGTDNFIQDSLSICNKSLDLTIQFLSLALFSGIMSYFCIKRLKYSEVLNKL
ncbi:MAG: hypothetical protein ABIH28_03345 [archaeon]